MTRKRVATAPLTRYTQPEPELTLLLQKLALELPAPTATQRSPPASSQPPPRSADTAGPQ